MGSTPYLLVDLGRRSSANTSTDPNIEAFLKFFPAIKDIIFELEEHQYGKPYGDDAYMLRYAFRLKSGKVPPQILPCSDPLCKKGGFDIGRVIKTMYLYRETHRKGVLVCNGKHERGHCTQQALYTVRVKYKG